MLIDCDSCEVRECDGCVVTALLGMPARTGINIDERERQALDVLADVGLVPPLRLSISTERAS